MDAREFLSRAWKIETQIQSRMEQIEQLRSLACRVTPQYGGAGGSRFRNVTAMEDTIVRITEAEEILNRKINELVTAKLGVMEVIDRVPDVKLRLILEKRYLLFHSWEDVADEMAYTRRWILKKHADALDAVQRILCKREAEREKKKEGQTRRCARTRGSAIFRKECTGIHPKTLECVRGGMLRLP